MWVHWGKYRFQHKNTYKINLNIFIYITPSLSNRVKGVNKMSLYKEMKKENHRSLSIDFKMRPVKNKDNYIGIVAKSTLLEDARKRKADRAKNSTLDQFFTPPIITV